MKIVKEDTVKVIKGKYSDRGKIGKVLKVFPKENKVIVEGVNIAKRHSKPTQKNPQGGIIEKEAPIHISNVSLIDPKSGKATRVAIKRENGNVQRIAKKSGEVI